jgi:hypothetical protein
MTIGRPRAPRGLVVPACVAVALSLLLASCGDGREPGGGSPPVNLAASAAVAAAPAGLEAACVGSGAHDRHETMGVACATCHPCGGAVELAAVQYPGGTTSEGGTVTRDASGATCSVGCHSPLGAAPTPVSWSAGPLACTACHNNVVPQDVSAVRSGHFVGVTNPSTIDCAACHDNSAHTSGQVVLVVGDSSNPAGACVACHDGDGATIGGATPPLLVGWSESAAGDFHGARAGTGYGGTLRPPYARGQDPLSCRVCHGSHFSTNEFLFAPTVNGVAIQPGVIGRAGVGAEVLCNACHEGDRHAQCKTCHRAVKLDMGDGHVWFDMNTPAVDPAPPGYPCFWCHGHEGIVNWTQPGAITDDMTLAWNESCDHCHNFGAPAVETAPPAIAYSGAIRVAALTGTSATIAWGTNERSTSQVEYGLTTPNRVATGAPGWTHSVTLSDLTPGTTHVYRVRSSDDYRNVMLSQLLSFTTPLANAPPAPAVFDTPGQVGPADAFTFTMAWSPVTAPDGHPVEYRMVLSQYPDFRTVDIDTGWTAATSHTADLSTYSALGSYYWHVQARDAVHDVASPWSSVDEFFAWDDRE